MIKEHCSVCKRIYMGEECPCRRGGRYKKLVCDCGELAEHVYINDLGEWALCGKCLSLLSDPGDEDQGTARGSAAGGAAPAFAPPEVQQTGYPFGLTKRQYQVACQAHLTDKQIAEQMNISSNTVRYHLKAVFTKTGAKSRYEVRHILARIDRKETKSALLTKKRSSMFMLAHMLVEVGWRKLKDSFKSRIF